MFVLNIRTVDHACLPDVSDEWAGIDSLIPISKDVEHSLCVPLLSWGSRNDSRVSRVRRQLFNMVVFALPFGKYSTHQYEPH